MNGKPVDLPMSFRNQFFESYGLHLSNEHTLPAVVIHIETDDLASFDIRNQMDMRQMLINPKDRANLDVIFQKNIK